ncbi:hypothetical protein RhiirA4_547926 [Rhizophagus irregularis]|uniref:Uncharacterized protein n=1 Tax=Rhizophagus irregularis TaxID=588596 RepID=A0A2I1H4Z8_9GLOM|nr:hypothetical protein RhiirA4_547926 [Rhizophagus irregularis]
MPRILPIAGGLILDNTNKEASSQDKFSGVGLEEEQYESVKQTILNDESLSHDEKLEAINIISKNFDGFKILDNEGTFFKWTS